MEFLPLLRSKFDSQKPSLFELASEAQLSSLLPPTLRYLLTIATYRYPRYLLRILNSFNECYALLMVVIEYHYIKISGGGFTETFYGLKREKVPSVGEIPRASIATPSYVGEALALKKIDIWKNIAVMVGLPYLKRKLDESYETNTPRALLGANYTRMPLNPTLRQRVLHYYRLFLRKVYPNVNALYYFLILIFNVSYLNDNSRYHSPFLWLIQTRIRRNNEDVGAFSATNDLIKDSNTKNNLRNWVFGGLRTLLPVGIFALRFLEWWHASDFSRQLSKKTTESIELPLPANDKFPEKEVESESPSQKIFITETNDESKERLSTNDGNPIASTSLLPIYTLSPNSVEDCCPICQKNITSATVCQTGFIFCYRCIFRWLEGNHDKQIDFMKDKEGIWHSGKGRCAVSGKKVLGGTQGLRRLKI